MFFNLMLDWLGVGLAYAVAAGLAVGGGYLEFVLGPDPFGVPALGTFLRYLGKVLLLAAVALAVVTFGKGLGLEACQAASREAALRAQIERLQGEAVLKETAAAVAEDQLKKLAGQTDELQTLVAGYQAHANTLSACRRATDDDDRRLRDILQKHAPAR